MDQDSAGAHRRLAAPAQGRRHGEGVNWQVSADIRKLVVVLFLVACLTMLTAIGKASAEVTIPAMSVLAGYIVGNGKNAIQGNTSGPMLRPKDTVDVSTKEGDKNV